MIMFRHSRPEIERITRTLTLLNPDDLQARPATEFEVLLTGLNCGDTFVLEVEGPDARRAVERVARLPMFLREDAKQATQNSRSHRWEALELSAGILAGRQAGRCSAVVPAECALAGRR